VGGLNTYKIGALNAKKPKDWSACETLGEQVTYITHAIEGVIRSFLNLLSFGYVNADNHDNYFFHTPHFEKPEVQEFERLLTDLNSNIEMLKQQLFPDSDNTQAP